MMAFPRAQFQPHPSTLLASQGVPSKAYKLPASWLKEGSAVINVSTFKNVDEEDVLKVRAIYDAAVAACG